METRRSAINILMADNNRDEYLLMRDALCAARLGAALHLVETSEEILAFLFRRGKYAAWAPKPLPDLILLDRDLPRLNGLETVRQFKGDPRFKQIPTVLFATAWEEQDALDTQDLGISSVIVKPITIVQLVEVMNILAHYWCQKVELPVIQNTHLQLQGM